MDFAPRGDRLAALVQEATAKLEAAGELRRPARCTPPPRFECFCARMCEAYVFLLEDERTRPLADDPDVRPRYVRWGEAAGESHYWLAASRGILDLNFAPEDELDEDYVDYHDGAPARNRGFHPWKQDRRFPNNKDARAIMRAAWEILERRG